MLSGERRHYCPARMPILQKTPLPFGLRQPACFLAPKPAVAVPRHPVVHSIAQSSRHPVQGVQQSPGATQPAGRFERRIGAGENAVAGYQHDRVERFGRQPERPEQILAGFALQGRKPELTPPVVLQYPLHRSVAEVAHPIEQEYRKFKFRIHRLFCFFAGRFAKRRSKPPPALYPIKTGAIINVYITR